MRLEQLDYLVAIKKYGSMSVASEKLHVTQQTLSIALKKLETELALQLLIRTPKGAILSPDGDVIYEHAIAVLDHIDEINRYGQEKKMQEKDKTLSGIIKVAATQAMFQNFVGESIRRMYRDYPKLNITCTGFSHSDLLTQLANKQYEIGLMNISKDYFDRHHGALFAQHFNTQVITSGKLTLLVGRNSALLNQKSISLKSIAKKYTLACATDDQLTFLDLDPYFSKNSKVQNILQCSNVNIVLDSVIDSNCVAFSSCSAWQLMDYHRKDELIALPLRDNIPVLTIAITSKEQPLSLGGEKFLEVLCKIASTAE